jgi:hydroxyacyl-ACP dehydratase HTD2-like protein with hotdog domain
MQDYNPPAPYLRRMWAGGSFAWPSLRSIKIGDEITESTKVAKAEYKAGMIFVHQEKTFTRKDDDEVLVKEIRTHVYRPALDQVGSETPEVARKPQKAKCTCALKRSDIIHEGLRD